MVGLTGILTSLDDELRARAPIIARALRPGLDRRQLQGMVQRLSFELPPDVQALYEWHDGTDAVRQDVRAELFPGGQMLPLMDAIKAREEALIGDAEAERSHWNPG